LFAPFYLLYGDTVLKSQWKSAPTFCLSAQAVQDFANRYLLTDGEPISLSDTRDQELMARLATHASRAFADTIGEVKEHLDCPSTGIVAVDVSETFEDATVDAIISSLIAVSLCQAIMPSLPDRENNTPFSIFTASKDNSEKLDQVGVRGLSPVDVLDFHSDGSILNGELAVPDYIAIFNVFINYHDRGNFYWVPTNSIEGLPEIVEKVGLTEKYNFSLTPAVYDTAQSDIKVIEKRARAAIFSLADDGTITTFMNGTFEGQCGASDQSLDVTSEIKLAISSNPVRYSVPQESRRLIILNNAKGFHARDIFEHPVDGYEITRAYLRSASIAGKVVGQVLEG